jgi:Na+/H+-dicarboxylate symporter
MFQSLSVRIFIGLLAGLLVGSLIQWGIFGAFLGHGLVISASAVGTMFIHAIMLTVAPLVFFSIVTAVLELKDISTFGRLSVKTFGAYLINTLIAIAAAAGITWWLKPGLGLHLEVRHAIDQGSAELPSFVKLLTDVVPSNVVGAFESGNMLQIIFLAALIGLVVKMSASTYQTSVETFFKAGNEIMMNLITFVMKFAPFGVFALMIKLAALLDTSMFISVVQYMLLILLLLTFWIVVLYPFAVSLFTDISAFQFRRAVQEQFLFALSTASSNATIPVTMRTLIEKLKVNKMVAGFGVPLGATMNMGGVSIYITVATMFAANAYGMPITEEQLPVLLLNIFLLAVGSGGVPGGGLIMIGTLITQLGLPLEAFALIAAVDRLIDMVVTSVNVVGDTAVVTIVDRSEEKNA